MPGLPVRFHPVPYPLWRRKLPLKRYAAPLLRSIFPVSADENPPSTPRQLAQYMARWGLLGDMSEADARSRMADELPNVELTRPDLVPVYAADQPVRLPAQWEPMQTIILTWPSLYPPLWKLYAEMVSAILPVCDVTILVSRPAWASSVHLFLAQRGVADWGRIRFLHLPTDDIWVRDYGPFIGLNDSGDLVAVHATYDPLPNYPQANDNAMSARWAAHNRIPVREIDLHTEGGNFWSDGAGTLIMADEPLTRHARFGLSRAQIEMRLREAFQFDKLIVTPSLLQEETGHVDLLVKLADAQTILVTEAAPSINAATLRIAADIFRRETNACGQPYNVIELPALSRYYNWGVFSVWRTYTNALTVNGRVLVPVYGEPADETALLMYEQAMPAHEIIPINCRIGINGGGGVHCMTKEVPQKSSEFSEDEEY